MVLLALHDALCNARQLVARQQHTISEATGLGSLGGELCEPLFGGEHDGHHFMRNTTRLARCEEMPHLPLDVVHLACPLAGGSTTAVSWRASNSWVRRGPRPLGVPFHRSARRKQKGSSMIDPSGTREDDPVKHNLPPSPPLRQAVIIASSRGTLEGDELFASLQSRPPHVWRERSRLRITTPRPIGPITTTPRDLCGSPAVHGGSVMERRGRGDAGS